jgi:hypothetical protein
MQSRGRKDRRAALLEALDEQLVHLYRTDRRAYEAAMVLLFRMVEKK